MVKKGKPQRGELVIATVTKVNPFSAILRLDEYGKEGMIHISEVARKWVQDIKKVLKVGQQVVAIVTNSYDDSISLSLKRVNKYEAEEKLKEYKRAQKAEKMLKVVAKKLNITFDEAYRDIGLKLEQSFEEVFLGFHKASETDGKEQLLKAGFPEKHAAVIAEVAKDQMEIKEVKLKKVIDIKCYKPDGVEIIKKILSEAEKKYKVEIRYISAPDYSLTTETKNAKAGEKKLTEAFDEIKKQLGTNGECVLKGE